MEELIPRLQQLALVRFNQFLYPVDVFAPNAVTALQSNRIEPELGLAVVALDVDVRRFVSITRVKEEPEWPAPQYGRQVSMLP